MAMSMDDDDKQKETPRQYLIVSIVIFISLMILKFRGNINSTDNKMRPAEGRIFFHPQEANKYDHIYNMWFELWNTLEPLHLEFPLGGTDKSSNKIEINI